MCHIFGKIELDKYLYANDLTHYRTGAVPRMIEEIMITK
jgi:hypothetical protein